MDEKSTIEIRMKFADEEVIIKGSYREMDEELDIFVKFLRAEGYTNSSILMNLKGLVTELEGKIYD